MKKNPKIDINDEVESSEYGGRSKYVTVHWKSGAVTKHDKSIVGMAKCGKCKEHYIDIANKIKYDGYCRGCYAHEKYGIPEKINNWRMEYVWERQVSDTRVKKGNIFSTPHITKDWHGNDFGVGDLVLVGDEVNYPSPKKEAKVVDLHRYNGCYSREYQIFLGVVELNGKRIPKISSELVALTNIHVDYSDIKNKMKDLKDVPSAFNPADPKCKKFKKTFDDDIARSIWMMYRQYHLMDTPSIDRLTTGSLIIADEIRNNNIPKDRMHLWFKREFPQKTGLNLGDEYIIPLMPYLTGEKISSFKVTK